VLLAELPDDAAQPGPLVTRFDLPGHADVVDGRHEDQEPPRDRGVAGDARALGAERLLDDLDDHLLPFLEQLIDGQLPGRTVGGFVELGPDRRHRHRGGHGDGGAHRLGGRLRLVVALVVGFLDQPGKMAVVVPVVGVVRQLAGQLRRHPVTRNLDGRLHDVDGHRGLAVAGFELIELVGRADDVGDVEEPVTLQAEIDEGRLHPGQHLRDPALVDVPDHAAIALALDEELDHLVVLENRDHRFVVVRGDDHLLVHQPCSRVRRASGAAPRRAGSTRPPGPGTSCPPARPQ
jgi:hypothetical protein